MTSTQHQATAADETDSPGATIRQQIETGVLMSLGGHNFRYGRVCAFPGTDPLPSLVFNARILPMTKSGSRCTAPRTMQVVISLNGRDYYDIRVTYNQSGDRYGAQPPVVHYEADDVEVSTLSRLLLSLGYDGDTVTNPRLA